MVTVIVSLSGEFEWVRYNVYSSTDLSGKLWCDNENINNIMINDKPVAIFMLCSGGAPIRYCLTMVQIERMLTKSVDRLLW